MKNSLISLVMVLPFAFGITGCDAPEEPADAEFRCGPGEEGTLPPPEEGGSTTSSVKSKLTARVTGKFANANPAKIGGNKFWSKPKASGGSDSAQVEEPSDEELEDLQASGQLIESKAILTATGDNALDDVNAAADELITELEADPDVEVTNVSTAQVGANTATVTVTTTATSLASGE